MPSPESILSSPQETANLQKYMSTTSHKTSLHPQQGYNRFETRQKKDPTLSLLKETVFEGWPQKREKCPLLLHDYWNFRAELTVENGVLLKGDRILMPPTLRPEVLDIIHQGHLGQKKCLLWARTCVFWPGITKDIINKVDQCEPCQKYQRKAPKEPILQPQPPCRPWERLSSDTFQFKGQQYLLLTDQY